MITQSTSTQQDQLTQAWRDAVRIVSGRAADTLGLAFHSRIAKAQDLVLRDCVAPQEDGGYLVSGDSGHDYDVSTAFECGCPDYGSKAPELETGMIACKHTLAVILRQRSIQLMQARMDAKPAAVASIDLPEAPLSVNIRGVIAGRANAQMTVRAASIEELKRLLHEAALLFDPEAPGWGYPHPGA